MAELGDEMKTVLFATMNPAKVAKYQQKLAENGVKLMTLRDLDFGLSVEESGKSAIENARIKARAYYEKVKIPTIGMDNCLFFEGVKLEDQPGTHVRRIGGRELNDEEMIAHYTELVRRYGGKLTARWVYGMVLCDERGEQEFSWSLENFYMVTEPCERRNVGYPLDSITIVPKFNKYLAEMTQAEIAEMNTKDMDGEVVEFILASL